DAPPPHAHGHHARSVPAHKTPSAVNSAVHWQRPPGGGISARLRHTPAERNWQSGSREIRRSRSPLSGESSVRQNPVYSPAPPCLRPSFQRNDGWSPRCETSPWIAEADLPPPA